MKLLRSCSNFFTFSKSSGKFKNKFGKLVYFSRIESFSKKRYRLIDFFRFPVSGIIGYVRRIEYDPGRSCSICLVFYRNGFFSYILRCRGVATGSLVFCHSGGSVFFSSFQKILPMFHGICLPLRYFTSGSVVSSIQRGVGFHYPAVYSRSCGSFSKILRIRNKFSLIRLKSGTLLRVDKRSLACFGKVSSFNSRAFRIRKASSNLFFGFRSTVRGVAKNPVDHPHGGGEGKSSGGRPSVSPWGFLTKCGFKK